MEIALSRANLDQIEEMQTLLFRSIREVCGADYDDDPIILDSWCKNFSMNQIAGWIKSEDLYTVVASSEQNLLVGLGQLIPQKNRITLCHVLPEFLGKGIGRLIISDLEQRARDFGLDRIELNSSITALDFYLQQGYSRMGEAVVTNGVRSYPMIKTF